MFTAVWTATSIVFPLFVILGIGYLLASLHLIDQIFIRKANRLLFYFFIPLKLLTDTWTSQQTASMPVDLMIAVCLVLLLSTVCAWCLTRALKTDSKSTGTFLHTTVRSNYLFIGYPLLERIMGFVDPRASIITVGVITLFTLHGVLIMGYYGDEVDHSYQSRLKGILRNPLIIGTFVGFLLLKLQIPVPSLFLQTSSVLLPMATPFALITIGSTFYFSRSVIGSHIVAAGTVMKLLLSPLIALLVMRLMKLSTDDLIILFVIFGTPSAINTYSLAQEMKCNTTLCSSIIFASTCLSVITLTLGIMFIQAWL